MTVYQQWVRYVVFLLMPKVTFQWPWSFYWMCYTLTTWRVDQDASFLTLVPGAWFTDRQVGKLSTAAPYDQVQRPPASLTVYDTQHSIKVFRHFLLAFFNCFPGGHRSCVLTLIREWWIIRVYVPLNHIIMQMYHLRQFSELLLNYNV
jgi:hypothetical protein